jgi:hypothetical protein
MQHGQVKNITDGLAVMIGPVSPGLQGIDKIRLYGLAGFLAKCWNSCCSVLRGRFFRYYTQLYPQEM